MALSEDQRAMLRLLAQREQGYEDIAALMGLGVEEVRARVEEALTQLEREDEESPRPAAAPAEPEPAAAPPAPAPAPRQPEPEPSPPPVEPAPQAATAAGRAAPRVGGGGPPRFGLPKQPGARAAIVAGAVALVGIVVVLIVGDGGGNGTSSSAAGSGESAAQTTASNGALTQAVLRPVGGSGASGRAVFGRVEESLALQVEAEGLGASGEGRTYAIWLAKSAQQMVPLAEEDNVGGDGRLAAQFEVPVEILAYLANETFDEIVVTLADKKKLEASLRKATREVKSPAYTGTAVLRGKVTGPVVGAELPETAE